MRIAISSWIVTCFHTFCAFAAFLALVYALVEGGNRQSIGLFAAFIAVCVVAATITGAAHRSKWSAAFVGVATLVVAYLFVVSVAGAHPADIVLVGSLGILWVVVALLVIICALAIAFMAWTQEKSGH